MIASSIGSTPVSPTPPPAPAQTASRSQFNAVFSGARRAKDDTGTRSSAPDKSKASDNKSEPPTVSIPVTVLPRTILPISLGRAMAVESQLGDAKDSKGANDVNDAQPEILDLKTTPDKAGNQVEDLAFAAKLIETSTAAAPQTQAQTQAPLQTPAASVTTALPAKAATPLPVHPADQRVSTPARNTEPAQKQTDTSRPSISNSSDLHQSTGPVAAQPVHALSETTALRDAPSATPAPRTVEAPQQSAAVEHVAQTLERSSSSPVNEITVRISNPDQSSTSIRMVDRSGELHVAIRASDPQIVDSLRGNVEQLTSRLNSTGLSAEVWKPSTVTQAAPSESSSGDKSQEQPGTPQHQRDLSHGNQSSKQNYPDWVEEFYANNE